MTWDGKQGLPDGASGEGRVGNAPVIQRDFHSEPGIIDQETKAI